MDLVVAAEPVRLAVLPDDVLSGKDLDRALAVSTLEDVLLDLEPLTEFGVGFQEALREREIVSSLV